MAELVKMHRAGVQISVGEGDVPFYLRAGYVKGWGEEVVEPEGNPDEDELPEDAEKAGK